MKGKNDGCQKVDEVHFGEFEEFRILGSENQRGEKKKQKEGNFYEPGGLFHKE